MTCTRNFAFSDGKSILATVFSIAKSKISCIKGLNLRYFGNSTSLCLEVKNILQLVALYLTTVGSKKSFSLILGIT